MIDEERGRRFRAKYLCARASLDGSSRIVEAAIGVSRSALACRIFVDCELAGGDRDATFVIPDPVSWKEIRSRGRARFLFYAGTRQGFFIAVPVLITVLIRRGFEAALPAALLGGCLAALMSAEAFWQVAERQYQNRLRKLDDPDREEPIAPLRRFVSLFLIGVGALLGLLAALTLVMIVTIVDVQGTWIIVPLALLALGLALIFAARALRWPRRENRGVPREP
ncbi:MAG TPA: hypothetical protein VK745_19355 [Polyangiaceae bacterium]|nr:hypothetical protein [Polyangiaceae bacterium]